LDKSFGDHTGRQQNHIWTPEEIDDIRKNKYRHVPSTIVDKVRLLSCRGQGPARTCLDT